MSEEEAHHSESELRVGEVSKEAANISVPEERTGDTSLEGKTFKDRLYSLTKLKMVHKCKMKFYIY